MSETETIDEMNKLIEWLPAHLPAEGKPSVVHGDYRLDNRSCIRPSRRCGPASFRASSAGCAMGLPQMLTPRKTLLQCGR